METIEAFMAKQAADLERKKRDIAAYEALGPVPGLDPWLIYGELYGVRSIGFKLRDLGEFLAWARVECCPVHAIRGTYAIMHPWIPDKRDYQDASIKATGDIVVEYSSIMQGFEADVYLARGYKINFKLNQWAPRAPELMPRAHRRHNSERIERWSKPSGSNIGRSFIRPGVDQQSCDLETLLTFDEFEAIFAAK